MQITQENFYAARALIVGNERLRAGIGTLCEKTLHAVLKHTIEPNAAYHEIKQGRFFADIKNENGIIEIQTANFNALRTKLCEFLQTHVVTVVYPVAHIKHLVWINPETGETTERRKSPKKGKPCEVLKELYKIKPLLSNENLRVQIVLINLTEYRILNGWSADKKKGAARYERIPEELVSVTEINTKADYTALIPAGIPEKFTAKDFKRAAGLSPRAVSGAVSVLKEMGAIKQTGMQGRAFVYEIN